MRKTLKKVFSFALSLMCLGAIAACSQPPDTSKEEKNVINVMLDYNGGVGTIGTFEIEENADYTLESPTKKGYVFLGWQKDGVDVAQSGKWTDIAEYVILKAKWQAVIYSITYELTGGLTHENPVSYTVEDEDITLLAPNGDEDFLGWYDQAVGGIQVKSIDTSSAEPITLYGRWKTQSEDDGWTGRYEG